MITKAPAYATPETGIVRARRSDMVIEIVKGRDVSVPVQIRR